MKTPAIMICISSIALAAFLTNNGNRVGTWKGVGLMKQREKQKVRVAEITAAWGSPLQKQAGESALRAMLLSWKEFYSEKHQRNHIEIAFPPFLSSHPAQEMESASELICE